MTENASSASSRQEFERQVLARAASDSAFRADLLADPKGAIRRAYGVELPASIDLRVVEETPTVFYLVLPPVTAELTDEELSAVAGGAIAAPTAWPTKLPASTFTSLPDASVAVATTLPAINKS